VSEAARQPRVSKSGRGLIKPDPRLVSLLALWLVPAALMQLVPALENLQLPWLWLGAALALVAAHDLWRLSSDRPEFQLRRELPERWPVNASVRLELVISHQAGRELDLIAHELYPDSVEAEHMPQRHRLPAKQKLHLNWRATARQRGELTLPGCHLAWLSPLKLWWRRQRIERQDRVRVYPNFNLVVQYGRLAGDRRLGEMGIHLARRRGIGSDFHQLRDYRDGDSLRQVDWHATARMRKLIAKDYQEERDQRVVFLLDCSRRMRALDGHSSHFDQCLNAMLLLAHVAIRQGDEVAMQTLASADGRERILPPGRGQRQFSALLETIYDLEAGTGHPDFIGSVAELMNRQRRRSLVVVLTNLRDEDHGELDPALKMLRQRHLVVLADLREALTVNEASAPARPFDQALLEAGTILYREQRQAATRKLRQLGVIHLDLEPAQLPGALVSQYRKLKASGAF
jgi:uncharacterized protein (DUF58 family)